VTRETVIAFRNKKGGDIRKAKLKSLKQTVRTKISDFYRAAKEFEKGYQPRRNLVKEIPTIF
jgi:hypothetical protein